ncbi:MAG: tetratricopeptide repeat protein, partial [Flavobacteriales bacterium]
MIRTITIALALLAGCGNAFSFSGSNSGEFNREFNLAIKDLTMGRTVKALPRLLELSKADPTNANLHYLIGLCYTENADNPEEAISHLELAEKEMVRDYIVHSYQEKRVPIYVYYYLAKAYAQNGDCSKAVAAKEHFFNNYQVYADEDYYITQAQKLIADCINRPEILKPELCPEESMPFLEAVKVETTAPGNSRELKTRVVDYNMKSALYGIQIGAFK